MPLADLQMPSITGSEAVDKYIYIPERPPDSQILIQFVILSLIQKKPLNPAFSNAPPLIWRKTWLTWFKNIWWTQPLCQLRYIPKIITKAQLLTASLCRYICRGPSHTWRLGICVITPKVQLSERQRVLAFGVMLLADFQMPSMTVPEAVSA